MNRTITIRNTEEAVAVIAAHVARAVAGAATPGHDIETVGARMTTNKVLDTVRAAYEHRTRNVGDTPKDAVVAVGVRLIQAYRAQYGI